MEPLKDFLCWFSIIVFFFVFLDVSYFRGFIQSISDVADHIALITNDFIV